MKSNNFKQDGMLDDTYRDSPEWVKIISVLERLHSKKLNSQTSGEQKLILELKKEIKMLPALKKQKSLAENEWIKHANNVRDLILEKDPREFLRWQAIKDTMNVTNSFFVARELGYLVENSQWSNKWEKLLNEVKAGNPVPFILYSKSSGNSIHLTYDISQFEEKTNEDISKMDFIFEFGGGYGNLCRLIFKKGFIGRYVIFDFPVFSALQKYYLKSIHLPVYSSKDIYGKDYGITCLSNIRDLEILTNLVSKEKSKNLFIASWSLSESPLETRKQIIKFMSLFANFLIGYQDKFGEVNNRDYFKKLIKSSPSIVWHNWAIKHLPAHNFLMGSLRKK